MMAKEITLSHLIENFTCITSLHYQKSIKQMIFLEHFMHLAIINENDDKIIIYDKNNE